MIFLTPLLSKSFNLMLNLKDLLGVDIDIGFGLGKDKDKQVVLS